MAVRSINGDDWVLWRDLRLEALVADAGAFGSTHKREAEFDEATWRQRMTSFEGRPIGTFIDEVDGKAVGMAGIGFFENKTAPMLVSMWVRPVARSLGCGTRLVDAAIAWAREQAAPELMLWVVRGNLDAIHLYKQCGFVASGKVNVRPSDPSIEELEMRLALR